MACHAVFTTLLAVLAVCVSLVLSLRWACLGYAGHNQLRCHDSGSHPHSNTNHRQSIKLRRRSPHLTAGASPGRSPHLREPHFHSCASVRLPVCLHTFRMYRPPRDHATPFRPHPVSPLCTLPPIRELRCQRSVRSRIPSRVGSGHWVVRKEQMLPPNQGSVSPQNAPSCQGRQGHQEPHSSTAHANLWLHEVTECQRTTPPPPFPLPWVMARRGAASRARHSFDARSTSEQAGIDIDVGEAPSNQAVPPAIHPPNPPLLLIYRAAKLARFSSYPSDLVLLDAPCAPP